MKKYILTTSFLITFFMTTPVFAAGHLVTVHVNGMVCDFCARSIEKVFSKKEEVSDIAVSLKDKTIRLTLKDGANIDDTAIKQLITDSGYSIQRIER